MGAFKRARQTVADVQRWGRDSAAYADEQRVKRGEQPKQPPNTRKDGRR